MNRLPVLILPQTQLLHCLSVLCSSCLPVLPQETPLLINSVNDKVCKSSPYYLGETQLLILMMNKSILVMNAALAFSVLGGIIWSEVSAVGYGLEFLTFSIAYILRLCLCVQLLSGRALLNSMVSVKMKLSS